MAKLEKGAMMPDFTFNTGYKTGLKVSEVVKDAERTIFWVLRYIGCTTCRYDVHVLAGRYNEFVNKGAQIYVVMQSDAAIVRRDLEGYEMPFEIICDTEMEIYKELEIGSFDKDEPRAPATMEKIMEKVGKAKALGFEHGDYEGNEQQLPALFVTGKDAKVIYAHYAKDGADMPNADEMLAILDTL